MVQTWKRVLLWFFFFFFFFFFLTKERVRRLGIVRKITGAQGLSHLLSVKRRPEEAGEQSKVLVLSCVWQLFLGGHYLTKREVGISNPGGDGRVRKD